MTRSTKLGIASSIFFAIAVGGLMIRGPISFFAAAIAWILGVAAGLRGNKAWLLIPLVVIIGFSSFLIVASNHH